LGNFIGSENMNSFQAFLYKFFSYPCLILIGGRWKTGKTDFALFVSEHLTRIPYKNPDEFLITEVASNIETYGKYPFIHDLLSLKQWLYSSNKRKLYILDEASEHFSSRTSMSSKNVAFTQLIPEISKAHARLLIIGHQLSNVDKTLTDNTYCRGVFIKTSLKTAQFFSDLVNHPIVFKDVPPTSIKFDPYAIAPFTEKPVGKAIFKDQDKQVLWEWCHGKSFRSLGLHPMQLNRLLRKYIKISLENDVHTSHS